VHVLTVALFLGDQYHLTLGDAELTSRLPCEVIESFVSRLLGRWRCCRWSRWRWRWSSHRRCRLIACVTCTIRQSCNRLGHRSRLCCGRDRCWLCLPGLSRSTRKLRGTSSGSSGSKQFALRDWFGRNLLAFGCSLRYRVRGLPWTCMYSTALVQIIPRYCWIFDTLDLRRLARFLIELDPIRCQYL
jgi:hypothetical protein